MSCVLTIGFYDEHDEVVYHKEFVMSNALFVSCSNLAKFLKEHSKDFCYYSIEKVEVET